MLFFANSICISLKGGVSVLQKNGLNSKEFHCLSSCVHKQTQIVFRFRDMLTYHIFIRTDFEGIARRDILVRCLQQLTNAGHSSANAVSDDNPESSELHNEHELACELQDVAPQPCTQAEQTETIERSVQNESPEELSSYYPSDKVL